MPGRLGSGINCKRPWRDGTDLASRRGQVLQVVPWNRLPGIGAALADVGIEKLNWLRGAGTRAIGSLGEIASAFSRGRNRGKLIEGILTARAVVIHKEKRLGSTLINMRNVERTAERAPKPVLRVSGLGGRLRRSGRMERRSRAELPAGVVQRTMGTIDVETAAAARPPPPPIPGPPPKPPPPKPPSLHRRDRLISLHRILRVARGIRRSVREIHRCSCFPWDWKCCRRRQPTRWLSLPRAPEPACPREQFDLRSLPFGSLGLR